MVPPSQLCLSEFGLRAQSRTLWGQLCAGPRLAVIGSRACHESGRQRAKVAVELATRHGYALVSGGALGIDACAHGYALEIGCPQLAVLPLGEDNLYPARNRSLLEAIAREKGSGLLFAQPPGTPVRRAMFASRNRIVVGAATRLVAAELSPRSGSAGTVRLALRAGVPVVLPLDSALSAQLCSEGAQGLRPERWGQDLQSWLQGDRISYEPVWPRHLLPLRRELLRKGKEGLHLDGFSDPVQALCLLSEAESRGLVASEGNGRWVLIGTPGDL